MAKSPYSIRSVDGSEEEIAEVLHELHSLTFFNSAPPIEPEHGYWWIAYHGKEPIGFAGMSAAIQHLNHGYMCRSGVLTAHRGHGLQRRLLLVREKAAKKMGWIGGVTDTYGNNHSANNLIAAGYKIYTPRIAWAFTNAIYWRKKFV